MKDASNRLVLIAGTPNFSVNVMSQFAIVRLIVAESLETDVILGCDLCDAHVWAICLRNREVQLADGATVPILQGPQKRSKEIFPLLKERGCIALKSHSNHKIIACKKVILQPGSHTWATIPTSQSGLVQIESYPRLYETRRCATAHGIGQVKAETDFKFMATNFEDRPTTLRQGQ